MIMKKSYLIFLVIISVIEVILVVLLVYFPAYSSIIYFFIIGAPILVPLLLAICYLYALFTGVNTLTYREDEQPPLTYKEFQATNPYFCENCSDYTSHLMQLCENCGVENSLRRTTKKDYK